ncbi:MAG: AAA family ATPase [Deltaproteobacteria bacterium]|nr:AAA family ATPase [Deltaproteobacteria bacterium]
MRRIALVNQKGGCGKTTTAINLAAFLAEAGRRVLLIDLDPQGHVGLGLGVDTEALHASVYEVMTGKVAVADAIRPVHDNLDAVFSDVVLSAFEQVMAGVPEREYKLAQALEPVEDQYDYFIIDSPPSVGLLTFNGLMAANEVVIPVDPSHFSLHGLGKLLDTIRILEEKAAHRLSIRVLAANIDRRTRFCNHVVEMLKEHFSDRCFSTVIHTCTRLREAAVRGKPIGVYDRRCNAYRDYYDLASEVLRREGVAARPKLQDRDESSTGDRIQEKAVVFTIQAPADAKVQIAGDFNGWRPERLLYTQDDGRPAWQKLIALKPGRYQYKYLIDGRWTIDPENDKTIDDTHGGVNSVLTV